MTFWEFLLYFILADVVIALVWVAFAMFAHGTMTATDALGEARSGRAARKWEAIEADLEDDDEGNDRRNTTTHTKRTRSSTKTNS